MLSNLAKTPLTAIFYASFFYFISAVIFDVLPYSQEYKAVMAGFAMPLQGYIMLAAFGFWLSVILALYYSAAHSMGVMTIISAAISFLGLEWVMPYAYKLIFGDPSGVMARTDILLVMATGAVCTIFLFLTGALLFRKKEPAPLVPPRPGLPATPHAAHPPGHKIKTLSLIIKILVLPFIYMVLYFAAWYFLEWGNDAVRLYYGGPAELPGFTVSMISLLTNNPIIIPFALIKGLLYVLLTLPILMRIPDKRALFVVITLMLYLGEAVRAFSPDPLIPADARIGISIHSAALAGAYALVGALLLHICYKKLDIHNPHAPRAPHTGANLTPEQAARAAAMAKQPNANAAANAKPDAQVLPGVNAKEAAEVLQSAMKGKNKK